MRKKINSLNWLLLAVMFLGISVTSLTACQQLDDGDFTEPITMYEKLPGTWNLVSLTQIDERALANGDKVTEVDLTSLFETFSITLNVDAAKQPTTYTITGSAPALLPVEGYWKLSNDFQNWDGTPLTLVLYSDASKTQPTAQVQVTTVPGNDRTLGFTLTRKTNGVAFVSYNYKLTPVIE